VPLFLRTIGLDLWPHPPIPAPSRRARVPGGPRNAGRLQALKPPRLYPGRSAHPGPNRRPAHRRLHLTVPPPRPPCPCPRIRPGSFLMSNALPLFVPHYRRRVHGQPRTSGRCPTTTGPPEGRHRPPSPRPCFRAASVQPSALERAACAPPSRGRHARRTSCQWAWPPPWPVFHTDDEGDRANDNKIGVFVP